MELILNTNEFGYKFFLDAHIDSIIIGIKNFCINQPFSLTIKEIRAAVKDIKEKRKKIYLSLNTFACEKDILKIKKIIPRLLKLNVDGYIVSDLGILNLFKELNEEKKVILDLQTYATNKYSVQSLLNLGVNRVVLSKEITLDDIKEISAFNNSKIELLAQGFYPITYSKRPILSCYFKNFKIKKKSNLYYIKEEFRNDFYRILECKNNLSVYNSKQFSILNYLPELLEKNVSYLRIDTNFLEENEIKEYIETYYRAIQCIKNNQLEEYTKIKEEFNSKYEFDTPFLFNESFLLKEGK